MKCLRGVKGAVSNSIYFGIITIQSILVGTCVCVCMCACVRACVRARVFARVRGVRGGVRVSAPLLFTGALTRKR